MPFTATSYRFLATVLIGSMASISVAQTQSPSAAPLPEAMTLKGQICKTERKLENNGTRLQYSLKMSDGRVQLPDMPRTDGTSVVINLDEFVDQFVQLQVQGYRKQVDDQTWITAESIQSVQKITEDEAWGTATMTLTGILRRTECTITVNETNHTTRESFHLEINGTLTPLPASPDGATNFNQWVNENVELIVKASQTQFGTNLLETTVQAVQSIRALP